ncbi:plant/protein [Rhynchospora pubera]|uniref:Plant/protein n=1 Tax=Rhynchospora pubera TaxID=906938 RepID=A0AAV8E6I5_9POAL|nr:plant/protein [Rhynchospora pubera]
MSTGNSGRNVEMLSREQLLHLFSRFSFLVSLPDAKKRILDAVRDKQEAIAVTTAIQEEILLEMGIDPGFGIGCLGKVNTVYENDMELMIKFFQFVAKEEMAIDEAELDPDEFAQKINAQQAFQNQDPIQRVCGGMCRQSWSTAGGPCSVQLAFSFLNF